MSSRGIADVSDARDPDARDLDANETDDVTGRLARSSHRYRYADLPDDVLLLARACLLDWTAVSVAGSDEEATQIVRTEARAEGATPRATLIGTGERVSAVQAALVNGTAAHALDFDDVSQAMDGHPSAALWPALVALAEEVPLDGRVLLEAFVVGFELECVVGRLMGPDHYAAGWHATETIGVIGAALACAHALGLSDEQRQIAIGLAATQAAGMKVNFGTMAKPLHAGLAAANGLRAARLAARGFTANPAILDVARGFVSLYAGSGDETEAFRLARTDFHLRDVMFKVHAACFFTHSSIDGVSELVAAHDLTPGDIRSIELRVPPQHLTACNISDPSTPLEAKFSLRFTAGMAAARRDLGSEGFSPEVVADPALRALHDKVVVVADPAQRRVYESLVSLTTTDGITVRASVDMAQSRREGAEVQWTRVEGKARQLVAGVLGSGAASAVVDAVSAIDDAPSVEALVAAATRPS
ncbi:MAG: MmgE/PrpD family protein [Acidimicrobiia bacterium]